jgi:hypothetical protein
MRYGHVPSHNPRFAIAKRSALDQRLASAETECMNTIHHSPARPAGPCLSDFERRCLIKRISDCNELIQLAVMGADSVRDRSAGLAELEHIGDALDAAQRLIARAESLAARLAEPQFC